MPLVATLRDRVIPASPLARRLSAQSILFAVGEGAFLTGAVFFTRSWASPPLRSVSA